MDFVMTRLYQLGGGAAPSEGRMPALDYEPPLDTAVAQRAVAAGREPYELALELMLQDGGRELLMFTHENYANGSLDEVHDMLADEHTILGLGDAGAHCGAICDAGWPTYLLTHWSRDRSRGPQLPRELLIAKMTRDPAVTFGMHDRGALIPGLRADINVIDMARLSLDAPRAEYDLPLGGRRLVQRAVGYAHTFCHGEEVVRDDTPTSARPGRLCRCAPDPPGTWSPCRLFLGPGFRLAARWNRLVETVKTRKKREKTGKNGRDTA